MPFSAHSGPSGNRDSSLEVFLLGTVEFESALLLQQHLIFELSGQKGRQGALLICEHPPLITIGREGSRSQLNCDPRELAARQIDVRWINRGGGCLVHAPGQLAIYPILPMLRLGMGVDDYRQVLHQTLLETCSESRVSAWCQPSETGIWCRTGQVGFVGAAIKSWMSYHGMFLNVNPDMNWFQLCQLNTINRKASSLSAELLKPISMHSIRESVARLFAKECQYRRYHFYTGHPLLRRTRKVIAYA